MEKPKRILIVDDDKTIFTILGKYILTLGHEVETAKDGIEALDKLTTGIDLVLLDVNMPRMDGLEVTRWIRKNPQLHELPIIIVTAYTSRKQNIQALEAGADDFVAKPVEFTEIKARINSQLRRKEAVDALKDHKVELEEKVRKRTVELEKSNRDLQTSNNECMRVANQVRILSQEVMKAQEKERRRLSHELHDIIAQDISSIRMDMDTSISRMLDIPPQITEKVTEISLRLKKTTTDIRRMTYELHPSGLDVLGLVDCLSHYCEEFSNKNNINVKFNSTGIEDVDFDMETRINIYRLVQEALTNVSNHAEATNVKIKMVASSPDLIVRIEDNGKGFAVKKALFNSLRERRMGLHAMNERMNLLGGKFDIRSNSRSGTKIVVRIPIAKNNDV